jgi:large subunit ribosomal protein L24
MKLKKSDKVMVMAGRDKGKTGEITRVIPADNQVVVEGVNVIKKHTKPSQKQPRGGILEITKPMPISKVALVCPNCKKPTRVGYETKGEHKERICRKCKGSIK